MRPLRGGISSSVYLVQVEDAAGARSAVVVRRYGDHWPPSKPSVSEREFKLLAVLAQCAFRSPRPLMVEAEGGPFGSPTVVMTRLPGRPLLAPRDVPRYVQQMARTLVDLHGLPTHELDFLRDQRDRVTEVLSAPPHTADALRLAVHAAAAAEWVRVCQVPVRHSLVHGDYWPGNLLWVRGRLVGVIDWEQPRLGSPVEDVATSRGDLSVLFGPAAADHFLREYERAAGVSIGAADLRFWDLMIASVAVRQMPAWTAAYRVLGRPDLTPELANGRIRAFARAALEAR
ncbi:MAG: phosphotransferase [Chloroflexi bacterium]|nr:phosphotransferase [Chloroflexota bacterium]